MTIKLEIDSAFCTVTEWRALVAFASIMTGGQLLPAEESVQERSERNGRLPAHVEIAETAIAPADNPEAGIDTDAALQSAGFGSGNALAGTETGASVAAVPDAGAVPPAPPAMPPAPPVPATAPAADGVPRDSKGLPWDHRIHSSSRSQNKDSSWRYKKGIDDSVIASVEAELRAVLNVSAPVPSVPAVPAPPAPPVPGSLVVPGAPGMTFMQLLPKVTGAIKAGTLTQETVKAALVEFSLPNLPAIHHRPDLVQAFHDRLFGGA